MKKMMMILALLFAMVGSSFGEGYYNCVVNNASSGWFEDGCITITSYLTDDGVGTPELRPRIHIRTASNEVFTYVCTSTGIDDEYKVILSQVIGAINTNSKVNPYLLTDTPSIIGIYKLYTFSKLVVHNN